MSTICGFDHIEDKHNSYSYYNSYYLRKFCTSLKEHKNNIFDFEKKKMLPLTVGESKLNQDGKECYFCGKRILTKLSKKINYKKVRDHCHYTGKYRGSAHSICNLKFNVPNEVPVVFHNGSNYDYHFIIKELISKRV